MLTENETIVIKKGIEKGYDLEMLSAEFEVSMEKILKMKQEVFASKKERIAISENEKTIASKIPNKAEIKPKAMSEIARPKVPQTAVEIKTSAIRKMEEIRKRYYQLFYSLQNNDVAVPRAKENTPEENAIIQGVIEKVRVQIDELKECATAKVKYQIKEIHLTLKKIEDLNLTVEQGNTLVNLIEHKNCSRVAIVREAYIREAFSRSRKMIFNKFAKAVSVAVQNTTNIDELKKLNKLLPSELVEKNNMILGPVKRTVYTKISNIQQNSVLNNIGKNLSPELSSLISDICSGSVKKEIAQNVILDEINKIQSNQFLKDSQKRESVLIKIRSAIKMNPEKFEIQNGENAVKTIQELTECDSTQALECVVINFIGRKKYDEAKKICDMQLQNVEKDNFNRIKNIDRIKRKIIVSEIGDLILKGIKTRGTPEEEYAYIQMVEEKLKKACISLSNVDLGKSQDGKRKITLADVWEDRTR